MSAGVVRSLVEKAMVVVNNLVKIEERKDAIVEEGGIGSDRRWVGEGEGV